MGSGPCGLREGIVGRGSAQLPRTPSLSFPRTCSFGARERVGEGRKEDGREEDRADSGDSERSLPAWGGRAGGGEGVAARRRGSRPPPAPPGGLLARPAAEALPLPLPSARSCPGVLGLHGAPRAVAAPRPGAGPGPCRHFGGPRQVALPAGAAAQPAPGPTARVSRLPIWVAEGQAGDARDKAQEKSRQLQGADLEELASPPRATGREVGGDGGKASSGDFGEEPGGKADQRLQTQAKSMRPPDPGFQLILPAGSRTGALAAVHVFQSGPCPEPSDVTWGPHKLAVCKAPRLMARPCAHHLAGDSVLQAQPGQ